MTGWAFDAGAAPNPGSSVDFLAPFVTVSLGDNQHAFVSSSREFGSISTYGASGLSLWICYRPTGGLGLTKVGPGMTNLQVSQNTRYPFSLNAVVSGLPAGSYDIGLCGLAAGYSPPYWNSNGSGYTSAVVFSGPTP